jgi:hypothetical protein
MNQNEFESICDYGKGDGEKSPLNKKALMEVNDMMSTKTHPSNKKPFMV